MFAAGQPLTASALNAANQVIGGKRRTTSASATSGTTELVVLDTPSLDLPSSGLFEARATVFWDPSSASDRFIFRIRENNISGSILVQVTVPDTNSAVPYGTNLIVPYATTAAETGKVFVLTAQRLAGTGTCTVTSRSMLIVKQLGSSTLLNTV